MASFLSTCRVIASTPSPKPWNNNNHPKSSTPTPIIIIIKRSFIPKAIPPYSSSSLSSSSSSSWDNNSNNNNKREEDEEMATTMKRIKYEGTRRRAKVLTELIEKKIEEAEKVCNEDKSSDGCKVAWDEVEEISAAKANLKLQLLTKGDPLESFCSQNPDTEECRVHYDRED